MKIYMMAVEFKKVVSVQVEAMNLNDAQAAVDDLFDTNTELRAASRLDYDDVEYQVVGVVQIDEVIV